MNKPTLFIKKQTLFFILAIASSGFSYGYNIGNLSGLLLFIKKQINMAAAIESSLFASAFLWGNMLIMIFLSFGSEKLGRKKVIQFGALLEIFAILISATSHNPEQLIIGRFITGIACGALTLATPLYLAEILPEKIRGRGTVLYQLFLTFGIFFATLMCLKFTSTAAWRKIIGIELLPVMFIFSIAMLIPESPRWLINNNFLQSAKKSLEKIYFIESAQKEFNLILSCRNSLSNNSHVRFKKAYLFPLLLAISLGAFNQLIGINIFLQYDAIILLEAGLDRHEMAFLGSTLITGINFLMTFFTLFLIDHFERKKLLQIGLVGIFICLTVTVVFNLLAPATIARGIATAICLLGIIIFFAIAPGAVVWPLRSEILPAKIRSIGLAISLIISNFCSALFSTLFLPMQYKIGITGIFIFCLMMTAIYIIISFYIPKTKQRSLEAIEQSL